jgi:hypothetical protein
VSKKDSTPINIFTFNIGEIRVYYAMTIENPASKQNVINPLKCKLVAG